jgi:hypothetical protein
MPSMVSSHHTGGDGIVAQGIPRSGYFRDKVVLHVLGEEIAPEPYLPKGFLCH